MFKFFLYLLLNIFFLPSWFQVLHTPNRLIFSQIQGHTLLWDSITVFVCLYINHMAKKYSSCKDVMDKAHKELKRTSYHISQFQLGPKSLIFHCFHCFFILIFHCFHCPFHCSSASRQKGKGALELWLPHNHWNPAHFTLPKIPQGLLAF